MVNRSVFSIVLAYFTFSLPSNTIRDVTDKRTYGVNTFPRSERRSRLMVSKQRVAVSMHCL
jgi:hypothetical protein